LGRRWRVIRQHGASAIEAATKSPAGLQPASGNAFVFVAFAANVFVIRGRIGLSFIRSGLLLLISALIVGGFVHLILNYHRT
jgi:hypothetical protein